MSELRKKIDPISPEAVMRRQQLEQAPDEIKERARHEVHQRANLENARSLRETMEVSPEREEFRLALAIAEEVKKEGGAAFVVGGFVRDEALRRFGKDIQPKDIDLEVFGISPNQLIELLKKFGDPGLVGKSFEVLSFQGIEISTPRREKKAGPGHRGFVVEGVPEMQMEEASRRRDFTINAMFLDPLTGEIIDKHGGLEDIENKIIRATDKRVLAEDPLRVLRAAQFAGRFGFDIEEETAELAKMAELRELPVERIGEEWKKMLLKSERPGIGLEVMRRLLVIEKLHPEINALIGCRQDPEWHPEGDVFAHTRMVVDVAAELARSRELAEDDALVVILSALCHDFGKPATTETNEAGRIISQGHPEAGIEPAKSFLRSINASRIIEERVLSLVREHLYPAQVKELTDAAVRRLAHRLHPATIRELLLVAEADQRGRDTLWRGFPTGDLLLQKAHELEVAAAKPRPILMGRHLIELDMEPGTHFGVILRQVFEAQLDGKIHTLEDAKALAIKLANSI